MASGKPKEGQPTSTKKGGDIEQQICFSGCPKGEEIIPECEVVPEGEEIILEGGFVDGLDKLYTTCQKNPGHTNFIQANEFKVDDLPKDLQTTKNVRHVFNSCILTVRVRVTYTSLARPDSFADSDGPYPYNDKKGDDKWVRYGTGSIVEVLYEQPVKDTPCPCPECRQSKQPKMMFWWVRARTATHVIFDKSEAESSRFECFYESDDKQQRKGIRRIYGLDIFHLLTKPHKKYPNDVCDVLCVTHDLDTAALFSDAMPSDHFLTPPEEPSETEKPSESKVIISHPHGCSKRITVGKILHLTVPIGEDYPAQTPIQFKKGTLYRKTPSYSEGDGTGEDNDSAQGLKLKTKEYQDIDEKDKEQDGNAVDSDLTGMLNEMREKLYTRRASLLAKQLIDDAESTCLGTAGPMPLNKEYVLGFYFLYLRVQILKIFVTASVLDQRTKGGSSTFDQRVQKAYQEICRVFYGREYHPSGDLSGSNCSPRLQHWIHLCAESRKDFAKLKSYEKEKPLPSSFTSSITIEWYQKLESVADEFEMRMKQNQEIKIESLLHELTERCVKDGFEIMTEYEEKLIQEMGDDVGDNGKKEVEKAEDKAVEETEDKAVEETENKTVEETENKTVEETENKTVEETENTTVEETENKTVEETENKTVEETENKTVEETENTEVEETEKKGVEEETDTSNAENNDGIDAGGGQDMKEVIPEGTTFTLPSSADYAFRVYSSSPGWIRFPEGTIMTLPDGKEKDIGEPTWEFLDASLRPEGSFVSYDIDTCNGSSGANVYCDILGPFLGTYFPHSGRLVHGGHNKSGLRDNFITLSSKMFLFGKGTESKDESSDAQKSLSLIKSCKTYLQILIGVLKRI